MAELRDVLALAEAINSKKEGDKEFTDLLTEISGVLSDILAAMERSRESPADERREGEDKAQAMGRALAQALAGMKPPTVTMPAPVVQANAWKELDIKFELANNGAIKGARIKRVA